jgi:hypothetical protein
VSIVEAFATDATNSENVRRAFLVLNGFCFSCFHLAALVGIEVVIRFRRRYLRGAGCDPVSVVNKSFDAVDGGLCSLWVDG